jgi:hypothetical protein
MSIRGRSFAGAFALAEQVDIDTPNSTPDVYIPVTSESVGTNRPLIERAGVYSSPEVQRTQGGLEVNNGDFSLEADGVALGLPLKFLIGKVTTAAKAGSITAAATATGGTSGTLADGNVQYRVANVFTRSLDGRRHIGGAAPLSTAVTLSGGGNGSVALSWTNATPPAGYTLTGTAIYRKVGSGDCLRIAYQAGSGTTYDDNGSSAQTSEVPPEPGFVHTFIPSIDLDDLDLPSFTVIKMLDIAESRMIAGCKMGQMTCTVAEDGNSPVNFTFGLLGREATKVANGSPTYTPVCSMLSHQSRVWIDGVVTNVAKALSITVNNNLQSVKVLDGNAFPKDHSEGMRQIGGTFTLGAENHDQWDRLKNGMPFAVLASIEGEGTTDGAAFRIDSNTVATPFPFECDFHMPKCKYDGTAGGNLNGSELMNEQPNYKANFSLADGYTLRIRLTNRVASLA